MRFTSIDYTLPQLTAQEGADLGGPLTLGEINGVLTGLVNGKTPGRDGLRAEFYKQYRGELAPKLLKLHEAAWESGVHPEAMREAIVIPLPKRGQETDTVSAYRPVIDAYGEFQNTEQGSCQ